MPVKVPNETPPLAEVLFVELEDVVVPVEFPVLDLSRENAMWGKHHHGCTTLTPAMHGKQRLIAAAKVITGKGIGIHVIDVIVIHGIHHGFGVADQSAVERLAILGPRGFYLNQFFLKPVIFMFINEVALSGVLSRPGYQGTLVRWYQGTRVPDTRIPGFPGTG